VRHTLASTNNCDCAQDLGIYFRTRKNKRSKVCDLFIEKIFVATVVIASRTYTHTQTQTHVHTDTQTHRRTDTQTYRHAVRPGAPVCVSMCTVRSDTHAHGHTDTQVYSAISGICLCVCVQLLHKHTNTRRRRHTLRTAACISSMSFRN